MPSRPDRRPPIAFSAGTSLTMLVAFLLMALTGGGCTVLGPDYQRPELDLPTGYRHAPATPADGQAADQLAPLQQAVPADDLPKGAWWEIYRDPMLDDLQAQAAAGNRELRVALARLEQARAATGLAEAELLPRLDLQPSGQRGRTPEALSPLGVAATATNLNLPLNLGYELDLWGRLRRQSEAAGADFAASAAEVENFRLLLHGEVARTYFNLRVTEHEQQLLARTVELRRDNLRLTESRYRNGLTSRLDVSRSQTELAVSEAELIALEQRRNELEHALALLLGETTVSVQQCRTFGRSARLEYSGYEAPGCLPESAVEELVGELGSDTNSNSNSNLRPKLSPGIHLPAVTPGLPAALLQRRPDVAAAERRLMAASARIGMAEAAFFPAIRLTGAAGFGSNELGNLLSIGNRFWNLGGQLSQPIFDGGRNRARLQQAQAAYEESLAAYQQVILQAFKEVDDALSALKLLARQQEAQQRALAAARQSVELSHFRYRAGLVSYLEVIESERNSLNLERAVLLTAGQQLQANLALVRALGGGWTTDHQGN